VGGHSIYGYGEFFLCLLNKLAKDEFLSYTRGHHIVFYESFYKIEIISKLILQSLWAIPGHWKLVFSDHGLFSEEQRS